MDADRGMVAQAMSAGSHGRVTLPDRPGTYERALCLAILGACIALLVYKLYLVDRININWDEFLYLSQVHAMERGELSAVFQGAYAHLFGWLTTTGADETGQIARARFVMVALLGLTAFMIWRLARRWLQGFSSFVAPLVYLSVLPVVQHGGSFRADSLLAPLTVGVLLLVLGPGRERRRDAWAGALCGVAIAVTIKAMLMLPMFAAIFASRMLGSGGRPGGGFRDGAAAIARFAIWCLATAAALLWLHSLTVNAPPTEPVAAYGGRVASKMLLDGPWFARGSLLQHYLHWQPLPWVLMALGAVAAVAKREFPLAALGLALLPVAFYRNAFPYFYVVMLAPAAPLAGFAVHTLRESLRPRHPMYGSAFLAVIAAGLIYQLGPPVRRMRDDDQAHQRLLVSAVHQIFTRPVAYVDSCGMIGTFRKANIFMSTWGMEEYRGRGQPFMPRALRESRPAFVLVNTPFLDPAVNSPRGLLPEDRRLISDFYPVYWGPVRVAGAEGRLEGLETVILPVPYAASYRLTTDKPVRIRGTTYRDGDVIDIRDGDLSVAVTGTVDSATASRVALFLAEANAPPAASPPRGSIFSDL